MSFAVDAKISALVRNEFRREGARSMSTVMPVQDEQPKIPVVVASRPGMMQQSLRAALSAFVGMSVIASAGDGLSALNQVVRLRPALLVIDSNLLKEEVEALLVSVKAACPATYCVVLLNAHQRGDWAKNSGADGVLDRDASNQHMQRVFMRAVG